jgi:nicotinamide-nucleotide amidase
MKKAYNPRAEILAVGSELLSPHFQDTNSLFLTERLNDLGLSVHFKSIVGDEWNDLCSAIETALARSDLILAIGGLGPTEDDRTREAFASVLGRDLIFSDNILSSIEARFSRRGIPMPDVNKKQAYLIEGCEGIKNPNGTAPGIWLETATNIIGLLPGPPHELKPMFDSSFYPRLQRFHRARTVRHVLKIAGLTESKVASLISDLHTGDSDTQMTILAYPGQIEIHLSSLSAGASGLAEKKIDALSRNLMESVIGRLLVERKETLAVAESCTGGYLGHRITNVPGSSEYFLLGLVVYSNTQKNRILGVPIELIEKYGAVSAEVAGKMAERVRTEAKAHYGLGITGIAGPGGGTAEKPVGLVYTALAAEKKLQVKKNTFLGDRERIKYQSSQKALDLLRRYLLQSH